MSVTAAILARAVSVEVRSRSKGTYDAKGNGIPGQLSCTYTNATIQPVSGAVLRDLPEGLRTEATHVGWSVLQIALADEIVYSGSVYRVLHVWPRPEDGFTKFAVKRVGS